MEYGISPTQSSSVNCSCARIVARPSRSDLEGLDVVTVRTGEMR